MEMENIINNLLYLEEWVSEREKYYDDSNTKEENEIYIFD